MPSAENDAVMKPNEDGSAADPTRVHNAENDALDIADDYRVPSDRESLGRMVRHVWVEWAKGQESPKPSWLVPWEGLDEPNREVDRRIGEALYLAGYANGLAARVLPPG